ncbi:PRA1 family protein B1-like [Typha latifolia]|uniref:PRA1 family protein B1-like n=1 Tax=Typha latifolia TaxID=4733 RepID=UPI003C2BB012
MMSSASSPPLLPVSNPTPAASPPSSAAADPNSIPAVRLFLSSLSDSIRRSLSDRRPWPELLDRSAFSRPESLADATSRLRKNLAYFRVNYVAFLAVALAVSLLAHPVSLLVLLTLLAAWCFLYLLRPSESSLVLFGRAFSDRETLGGLVLVSLLVVFLTSVGSLIISALTVGAVIVCAHGAFRMPEDLFLDEPEAAGGATAGLLSFLGGAGTTGALRI